MPADRKVTGRRVGRHHMFVCLAAVALTVLDAVPASSQLTMTPRRISFDRSDIEAFLPQSSVFDMVQDRRGFLWFGTREGLGRWDGYEMRHWRSVPFEGGTLPGNVVSRVVEDRDGHLWVRTQTADRTPLRVARLIAPDHERVQAFDFDAALPFRDTERVAWVADTDSVRRFDGTAFVGMYARITDAWPYTAFVDRTGAIWVGTYDGVIELYSPDGTVRVVAHDDPVQSGVGSFFEDDRGTLWLTGFGLRRIEDGRVVAVPTSNARLDAATTTMMLQDDDGWIWIATLDGMFRIDASLTSVEHYPLRQPRAATAPQPWVLSLLRDASGTIWAGTAWGLYRYDPAADLFGFYGYDPAQPAADRPVVVMAFHEDPDSDLLWIGTLGGGLQLLDRATGRTRRFGNGAGRDTLPDDWVWAVAGAIDGGVWLGIGHGLARVDPAARRPVTLITLPPTDAEWGTNVAALHADPDGGVWFGRGGRLLHRARDGGVRVFELPVPADIHHILRDEGSLWLATSAGLVRFDIATGAMRAFRHDEHDPTSLIDDVVFTLHFDRDGRLWIGTSNGLDRLEPDSGFAHVGLTREFPSSVIYGILEDDERLLWLATNRGLVRFDPRAPPAFGVHVFDRAIIGNTEFNRNAVLRSRDGTFLFGGDRGITYFHPSGLRDNAYRPPVRITALHRANRSGTRITPHVDETVPIVLEPDDYTVSIQLAALSFTEPARNRYEYRVDDLHDRWLSAGTSRTVSFTNLPPGRYVFRARASNEDGVWNDEALAVPLIVRPWLWQTWWFRAGLMLALAGLVSAATGFVLRSRHRLQLEAERRHHALEYERARISRDMHDEVGASLTEIALLSERTLREASVPRTRDPLVRIADRSRATIATIGEIIWAIDPSNDRLDRLAAYMREYASTFLDNTGLDGRVDIDLPHAPRVVSAELRRNVFLVMKEALANAAAHAQAAQIDVSLGVTDDRLRLIVRDDGVGFDTHRLAGPGHDGIANMRRRAQQLAGTLTIDSAPGRGSTVVLDMRLAADGTAGSDAGFDAHRTAAGRRHE